MRNFGKKVNEINGSLSRGDSALQHHIIVTVGPNTDIGVITLRAA